MNRRNNQRRNTNENHTKKKVTRCGLLRRPVFEHEVCPKYVVKQSSTVDSQGNNCKNCHHSF